MSSFVCSNVHFQRVTAKLIETVTSSDSMNVPYLYQLNGFTELNIRDLVYTWYELNEKTVSMQYDKDLEFVCDSLKSIVGTKTFDVMDYYQFSGALTCLRYQIEMEQFKEMGVVPTAKELKAHELLVYIINQTNQFLVNKVTSQPKYEWTLK